MTRKETLMRAALQRIVDFQPEYHELSREESADMMDCAECARSWTHHCDRHYRALARVQRENERERNSQWLDMKNIARAAIRLVDQP
jgi:hypothetical protein